MYCTNCGKPIPDTAAFCPECGARNLVFAARNTAESAPAATPVPAPVPQPVRTEDQTPAAGSAGGAAAVVRLIIGIVTVITACVYLLRTFGLSDLEGLRSLLRGRLSVITSGGEGFGGLLLASGIVSLSGRRGKGTGIAAACLFFTASLVGWAAGSGIGAEKVLGIVAGLFGTAVLILSLVGGGKDK